MPLQRFYDVDYTNRKVLNVVTSYPECDQLSEDVSEAFKLWQALKGDCTLPLHSDFHLDELPPKIVPWTIVYDIIDEGKDFYYRFFGTQRVNAHRKNYTGLHVSDMEPLSIRDKILGELREVCAEAKPTLITTTARAYDTEFQYRMLRLPLSENGETVSRIIAMTFDGTGPELNTHLMRRWHKTD